MTNPRFDSPVVSHRGVCKRSPQRTDGSTVPPFFMGKRSVGLALHKPFTSVGYMSSRESWDPGILGGGHTQDVCINLHNIKNDVLVEKSQE